MILKFLLHIIFLGLFLGSVYAGEIYKYTDDKGAEWIVDRKSAIPEKYLDQSELISQTGSSSKKSSKTISTSEKSSKTISTSESKALIQPIIKTTGRKFKGNKDDSYMTGDRTYKKYEKKKLKEVSNQNFRIIDTSDEIIEEELKKLLQYFMEIRQKLEADVGLITESLITVKITKGLYQGKKGIRTVSGLSVTHKNEIIINYSIFNASVKRIKTVIYHEYVHAAMKGWNYPAVFDEGMAVYFTKKFTGEQFYVRKDAKYIPIKKLTEVFTKYHHAQRIKQETHALYQQAWGIVEYLVDLKGEPYLLVMMQEFKKRKDMLEVLEDLFGYKPYQFDKKYKRWLTKNNLIKEQKL